MKSERVILLALACLPNAEIADIVGSRPRRIREIVSAAIKAGAPIAPNAERIASRRARNGPRTGERAEAAVDRFEADRPR